MLLDADETPAVFRCAPFERPPLLACAPVGGGGGADGLWSLAHSRSAAQGRTLTTSCDRRASEPAADRGDPGPRAGGARELAAARPEAAQQRAARCGRSGRFAASAARAGLARVRVVGRGVVGRGVVG